jgi:uncharacterized protein YwqG
MGTRIMNEDEMIRWLQGSPVSHLTEEIACRIRPSIRLTPQQVVAHDVDLGATRMGGLPDLPEGVEWPQRKGRLLSLLLQLRMSDVLGLDREAVLPSSGWLCFFYDAADQPWGFEPADHDGWRVVYFDVPIERLRRMPVPAHAQCVYQPCLVRVEAEDTLPDSSALITEGVLEHMSADFDVYFDLVDDRVHAEGDCRHRLLGNPDVIQGEMRFTCQYASNGIYCGDLSAEDDPRARVLAAGVEDWILLLQVDTDDDGPGWMWGDCGRIFFWIRKQDLARLDFDHVWLELQCS